MKLVSIINVWADSVELLPYCISNHLDFCDAVIVIGSSWSNSGTKSDIMDIFIREWPKMPEIIIERYEPSLRNTPQVNETLKRNFGIRCALNHPANFTHFLMADTDEFYKADEMLNEKERFDNPHLNGLVHPLKVYIKTPTLWTEDHTLVPGIHKLAPFVSCGNFKQYPFAYDSKGAAHIDPTRRMSYQSGIEWSNVFMHHYSYVRYDINMKIDNSSANLRRSRQTIYEELRDAKPGYVSRLYHRPLQECENYFNIVI